MDTLKNIHYMSATEANCSNTLEPLVQKSLHDKREDIVSVLKNRYGKKLMHLQNMVDILKSADCVPEKLLFATAEDRLALLKSYNPVFDTFSIATRKAYLVPRIWYPVVSHIFPEHVMLQKVAVATQNKEQMAMLLKERRFHLVLERKIKLNDVKNPVSFLGMNITEVCTLLEIPSGNTHDYKHKYQRIIEAVTSVDIPEVHQEHL